MKKFLLFLTHGLALAIGFAAGIYILPILIAPEGPSQSAVQAVAAAAQYETEFRRDLPGSDALHWGQGKVVLSPHQIALMGRLSPGPDYKLYLSKEFVDNREDFLRIKAQAHRVGDIKTFENFVVPVSGSVDLDQYRAVVVWCETFSQFITAAAYR